MEPSDGSVFGAFKTHRIRLCSDGTPERIFAVTKAERPLAEVFASNHRQDVMFAQCTSQYLVSFGEEDAGSGQHAP